MSALTPENVEEPTCNCPRFSDTSGYRIADLTCPTHGVNGTDPGDGMWDATPENVEPPSERCLGVENGQNCGGVVCRWNHVPSTPENVEEPK